MFDWLWRLLGYDGKPGWEKNPSLWHVCPECEECSKNVHWSFSSAKAGEIHGVPIEDYYYSCPNCEEKLDIDEYLEYRLDNVWDEGKV